MCAAVEFATHMLKPTGCQMAIELKQDDEVPQTVRYGMPQYVHAVATNGDGACSLHAVFGQPDAHGVLFAAEARKLAQMYMRRVRDTSSDQNLVAGSIHTVELSLWCEFVAPYLAGDISREGEIFWQELCSRHPLIAASCKVQHQANQARARGSAAAKARVLAASSSFFSKDMEEQFVRPLAIQLGYLPAGSNTECADDFRNSSHSADGYVCGTRLTFPAGGPPTKYAALFDVSHHFDAIRYSFLVAADATSGTTRFVTSLEAIVRDSAASLGLIERARSFCMLVQSLGDVNTPSQQPVNFVRDAWGAYCESIGHEDYYLSVDELLVICCAAKVNIAVFSQVERKLSFAGGTFHGEGPLICAQLWNNARRRVRSHFERLIGVDQLEEARARQLQLQKEQRLQQVEAQKRARLEAAEEARRVRLQEEQRRLQQQEAQKRARLDAAEEARRVRLQAEQRRLQQEEAQKRAQLEAEKQRQDMLVEQQRLEDATRARSEATAKARQGEGMARRDVADEKGKLLKYPRYMCFKKDFPR